MLKSSPPGMRAVEVTVLAPAKVNLCLRIIGRRVDGYHLLNSFLVPVSLYDELHLGLTASESRQNHVSLAVVSGVAPDDASNLTFQAAERLLASVRQRFAVQIRLKKRIPSGSGLGGGSSDAAAVLLALNRALGSPLRKLDLCQLAAGIGADVPFFIHGSPARVEGIGERLTRVRMPSALQLVICWPGYSLSTGAVYARFDAASLTTATHATNIEPFVSGPGPLTDLLVNDLEAAAGQIRPEVLSLKAKLVEEGALGALMTGSGSAVFGVWRDSQSAQGAAARLRRHGLWAEAVRTLEVSPAVAN